MVKLGFVDSRLRSAQDRPIGVVASLVTGFDRVAARPLLILPPLLLDLFLWLGPKVSISPLVDQIIAQLTLPSGAEPALVEQISTVQESLQAIAHRFNLLTALSSLPAGVPSLMAGLLPENTPLVWSTAVELGDPLLILLGWLVLTGVGLGLGALYHRGLARAAAPDMDLPSGWWAYSRLLALGALLYGGLLIGGGIAFLVATLAAFILPLLGIGVSFIAFSLLFWLLVYLVFTPHGIIRYRFGVMRAMMESALLVRWNFMATVGFLGAAVVISWLTNMVWSLPATQSWYALLAILGHSFISGTLLTGSYAYYQGRREWMVKVRDEIEARLENLERRRKLTPEDREEGDV
jgi:hypothetical protein